MVAVYEYVVQWMNIFCLQCVADLTLGYLKYSVLQFLDAVGWAAGRVSGL